ncbi:MAG TPA: hypothetical protein PKO17_04735 [Pseudomonadales bacterium]|nr:hypothetical protein [Pseudomonadales bacterium]
MTGSGLLRSFAVQRRVIGALLGIPEEDLQAIRHSADERIVTEEGKPIDYETQQIGGMPEFENYIDWRIKNPSDDVMTEFLNVEFVDDKNVKRKLSREEILSFCNVLAGAGNETTNRLMGWSAKVLHDHPDQRVGWPR